jgi:hypothetical protein
MDQVSLLALFLALVPTQASCGHVRGPTNEAPLDAAAPHDSSVDRPDAQVGDSGGPVGDAGLDGAAEADAGDASVKCVGCRDEAGTCLDGNDVLSCGRGGEACALCPGRCQDGPCEGDSNYVFVEPTCIEGACGFCNLRFDIVWNLRTCGECCGGAGLPGTVDDFCGEEGCR